MAIKLCVECRHQRIGELMGELICNEYLSPTVGKPLTCWNARMYGGPCGYEGRGFKEKGKAGDSHKTHAETVGKEIRCPTCGTRKDES